MNRNCPPVFTVFKDFFSDLSEIINLFNKLEVKPKGLVWILLRIFLDNLLVRG
jgi:hypothetical protein